MILDLEGVERYVDQLSPEARTNVEATLKTVVHYILGILDGSCYRYQSEIQTAIDVVRDDQRRAHRERLLGGRNE